MSGIARIRTNNDIESLIKLRNEFYAHTDRNPAFDIKSYRPKYDQIKIFIDFGFYFGNSLYFSIFKETWLQPSVKFGKASNVLEDMILAKEYRIKKTLGEYK